VFLERELRVLERAGLRVLHIAPERGIASRLEAAIGQGYVSADLRGADAGAAVALDVTAIPADHHGVYDLVIVFHVLEHVEDDRLAMHHVALTLSPGGTAVLHHPVDWQRQETYEDPAITSGADRARHFGQEDHVRQYGRDHLDRLRQARLDPVPRDYAKELTPRERKRFLIGDPGPFVVCTRAA
jgi:SAM-dependent methyltransferase